MSNRWTLAKVDNIVLGESISPGIAFVKGWLRGEPLVLEYATAYAQTIGLQGVAMISIDDDWSALRLKAVG